MPRFANLKWTLPAIAFGGFLACGAASAQQAAAGDERCTGTLCDLYYRTQGPPPPPGTRPAGQAASQPTAPSGGLLGSLFSPDAPAQPGSPAARAPVARGEGGGLVGALTGAPDDDRCTGTLCDLYYGGPAPARPARPAAGAAAAPPAADGGAQEAAAQGADDTQPAEPIIQRHEDRRCVATARDPWACAR